MMKGNKLLGSPPRLYPADTAASACLNSGTYNLVNNHDEGK